MERKSTFFFCGIVSCLFFALVACNASTLTPTPILITATQEVVYVVVTNTPTPTFIQPTLTKPPSRTPTRTIRPTATTIPTSTPSPIPSLLTPFATPLARDATTYPVLNEPIVAENLSNIVELARWGKGEIRELAFSPDSTIVATVTSLGVYFYDTTDFGLISFTEIDIPTGPVALSRDLEYVAVGTSYGQVWIWETQTGRVKKNFTVSDQRVIGLAISPDNRSIYTSSWNSNYYGEEDRKSFMWDLETTDRF